MAIARSIGQAILKTLVQYNLPGWQMIQTVRSAGYGYNYQTMLSDIREYTGRFKQEANISDLGFNDVIPKAWMNSVEMNYPYKYKVWADVTYWDPATSSYITDVRSVYTDDLMKKGDYAGFIEGVELSAGEGSGAQNYPGMTLTNVEIRGLDVNTRVH